MLQRDIKNSLEKIFNKIKDIENRIKKLEQTEQKSVINDKIEKNDNSKIHNNKKDIIKNITEKLNVENINQKCITKIEESDII